MSDSHPSSSNNYIPSHKNASIRPKLFKWNQEKPRKNSEYIGGKVNEAHNEIAPELRVIGGLGRLRCVDEDKVQQRRRLINRPTQVQRATHTKTKLLPNFPLTADLRHLTCPQEQQPRSVLEHVERVKFVENLPPPPSPAVSLKQEAQKSFNHQNPFDLDLSGFSEYQRQKSLADEAEMRRNYQIIRRTMETKKLQTEGRERIIQQERDEKFGLPELFKVCDEGEAARVDAEAAHLLHPCGRSGCKLVSVMDKPLIKAAAQQHYQHKEQKLRRQVKEQNVQEEKMQKEKAKKSQEDEENLIFHLADESLPASSDCVDGEEKLQRRLATFPRAYKKFDYPINESELYELQRKLNMGKELDEIKAEELLPGEHKDEEVGIACGDKIGNRVILRSFHDRLFSEPRGKINLHAKEANNEATCLTHQQWLHAISNDPQITSVPPRVKLISYLKPSREPNDDKTMLFDRCEHKKIDLASIESPIKQHIRKMHEHLKQRHTVEIKKSKNVNAKQLRRMNFMGIPIAHADAAKKCTRSEIQTIVTKISQTSMMKREQRVISTKDEGVKFFPAIPALESDDTEEIKHKKAPFRFKKAQPRGNDPKMLRIDKSLPWIGSVIDAARVEKLEMGEIHEGAKVSSQLDVEESENIAHINKETPDENQSAIKKSFNEIIASKLQDYATIGSDEMENSDSKVQSIESTSTLSSDGTYFSNDSGSYLMILDKKVPKTQLNIANKFQNRSLVTTQEQPPYETIPYLVADINLMKKLVKAPDRFHTCRTRSCANIRERVKVESPAYEDELIGDNKMKLAADMDDAYVKELYNHRSRTQYRFLPKTEIVKLRETVRSKMDSYYIQEKFILDKIHAENEAEVMHELQASITAYDNFLETFKEETHRKSMRTVEQVKKFYHATDELRIRHETLNSQIEPLKMKIFYHANEFLLRITYEDIQYLLKPIEWRLQHDHLHRVADSDELENFRESIEQRGKRNVWNRDNVTVMTIMSFINTTYPMDESTQQQQQVIKKQKLFESGDDLLKAFKSLQSKSFKALQKFTYAALMLTKLEHESSELEERSEKFIARYQTSTLQLHKRWSFMQSRVDEIKANVLSLMAKPLEESFGAPLLRDVTALCSHLFEDKLAVDASAKHFTAIEKFELIEKKVLDIFAALDKIPRSCTDEVEMQVRIASKKKWRVAKRAYKIECNIELTMTQLERLLAKPRKRVIRKGKLQRLVVPKSPPKPMKIPPLLSPLEEKYARAFMKLTGDTETMKFDESVLETIQKVKNESVPFYLDHFLAKRGFKVGKLNELQSEDILRDEEKLLKFKEVLSDVRKQVKVWKETAEREKEMNIEKTAYLY